MLLLSVLGWKYVDFDIKQCSSRAFICQMVQTWI